MVAKLTMGNLSIAFQLLLRAISVYCEEVLTNSSIQLLEIIRNVADEWFKSPVVSLIRRQCLLDKAVIAIFNQNRDKGAITRNDLWIDLVHFIERNKTHSFLSWSKLKIPPIDYLDTSLDRLSRIGILRLMESKRNSSFPRKYVLDDSVSSKDVIESVKINFSFHNN
jgi:hypothetical protein